MPITLDHVRQIEDQIIAICHHCQNVDDLKNTSAPIWNWACQVLEKPINELRVEIESHETDENFPDHFSEEKDHLLKLPLILLEHLHRSNIKPIRIRE